tara:strand:- start:1992 stop:2924 length:933 start_codon:yes stop_codon:yes gene_type:complete
MKIAVTSKAFAKNEALISLLSNHFPSYKLNHAGKLLSENEFIEFLADCDGVILAMEQLSEQVISRVPHIKAVAKFGVGTDNIDFAACEKARLPVFLSQGVNKQSVAEMVIGFALMLLRNLYLTSCNLSQGKWQKEGGVSLYHKTIGIIGFGHIGSEVARLLKPFSCRILVHDIVDKSDLCARLNAEQVPLEQLIEQADVISLHTPLTATTNNLVNSLFLQKMKRSAILINTARGEVVDLEALKLALQNKTIAGAAIDVYREEPPQDLELLSLPTLIPTPHIGGNSAEATYAMGEAAILALVNFFGAVDDE